MSIEYEWSPRIEAAARAIARIDGVIIGDKAFSVIATPRGLAAAYWSRAVAAIRAADSCDAAYRGGISA